MRQLIFLMLIFLAVLALALRGQYVHDPQAFLADPLECVYQGLRLFTLDGDWPPNVPITLEWQLARFLAPLVSIAGLVLVFAEGAWIGITSVRARFKRDHVVLVGLNLMGWHFVRSCRNARLGIVVIERDASNPYVDRARSIGAPVIIGDALTSQALVRAGVLTASDLVTFVRDDGTNVELTLRVKALNIARGSRRRALRVRCHLSDVQFATRLEQYPKFFLDAHLAEIGFFNVSGLAARMLLQRHPLEVYADVLRCDDLHIAVLGTGQLAEQVLLQVARTAHYASFEPPRISMCAEQIDRYRSRIERLYPGLPAAARLAFVEMPLAPDAFEAGDAPIPIHDATTYVVCLEDESAGLSLALALRRATLLGRGLNAPVMVAMERSTGLARLLESVQGTPEIPDGLYPFGMLNEVVSAETIVDERLDKLAQAFHENYLETVTARVDSAQRKPSQVPWPALAEMYRNASRLEADHVEIKLRAVGCREEEGDEPFKFEPQELERIAHMDRNRFVAVRFSTGWTSGPIRSDFARIDDSLKPWEECDANDRAYDMNTARDLPVMLAKRLRRTIKREIIVGVTGHRLHRLPNPGSAFARAVDLTLDHIRDLHPAATFSVMSSLAEGADRLIARAAMRRLEARLYVPLPLPFEVYVDDFGHSSAFDREASVIEFYELLGRADRYFELPLEFGTRVELAQATEAGAARRARQYALAGAYVAQRCHELVAVWDGGSHEGEGGTAQIVGWRVHGVPEMYRYRDRFFPPVQAAPPFVVAPGVGTEFVPMRLGEGGTSASD